MTPEAMQSYMQLAKRDGMFVCAVKMPSYVLLRDYLSAKNFNAAHMAFTKADMVNIARVAYMTGLVLGVHSPEYSATVLSHDPEKDGHNEVVKYITDEVAPWIGELE